MKKTILILLVLTLVFSLQTVAMAVTIDYSFSLDKKLYSGGEKVPGEEMVGNLNLGTTFQRDFGTMSIYGNLSYPLHEPEDLLEDHLSLNGSIDFFEGGSLHTRLNKDSMSISYMPLINNNVSVSLGNSWYFGESEQETNQRISVNYDKRLEDDAYLNMSANCSFENFENVKEASISVGFRKSIYLTGGKVINTSIRAEVYDDDNTNQQKDAGETPVSGIAFNLFKDEELVKEVKTSTGGIASLGELEPGNYRVELIISSLPQRFEITTERVKEINLEEKEIARISFGVTERKVKEKTTFSGEL